MTNSNGVLTPREVEVLQLVALEYTYDQIGLWLGISPQTVKNHMSKLLGKLDVESRVGAVLWAIRYGYVVVPGIRGMRNDR